MALEGSFKDLKFKVIEGYRISVGLHPRNGFENAFYVYVFDRVDARHPFERPIDLGDEGAYSRGELKISDKDRTYVFKDIQLTHAEIGANRRERFRFLEFQYDSESLTKTDVPAEITNEIPDILEQAALADSYTYSINDEEEHLLGFQARLDSVSKNVFRFSTLRNKGNSVLEEAIKMHNAVVASEEMPKLTIKFSQQQLDIEQRNLIRLFVDETYGTFNQFEPWRLGEAMGGDAQLTRTALHSMSPHELLGADAEPARFDSGEVHPRTIETTTIIFQQGHYRNPEIV